jgi:hypothetical protein
VTVTFEVTVTFGQASPRGEERLGRGLFCPLGDRLVILATDIFTKDGKSSPMNTPDIPNPTTEEKIMLVFGRILISSTVAFVGFCFVFIVALSIAFFIGMIQQENGDTLGTMLIVAPMLALAYGIAWSVALAIPFFPITILISLLAWRLKIIRWWTCTLGGCLFCVLPLGVMLLLPGLAILFMGVSEHWIDILSIIGGLFAAGLCGSVAGLFFWITLRLQNFPDVSGPLFNRVGLQQKALD